MDLTLNDAQSALQRAARDFLANESPRSLARAMEKDDLGYARDLWKQMADLGWLGLGISSTHGGADGTMSDLVTLYEELGRAVAPTPHLVSTILAAGVIENLGSEEQKSTLLRKIASGEIIVSFGYLEPEASWRPSGITMRARRDGDGFLLNGTKLFVPFAAAADQIIVVARIEGAGTEGITAFLVDAKDSGIALTKLRTIDNAPEYEAVLSDVRVDAGDVLGPVGNGWSGIHAAMQRAAVLQSAELVGIAQVALDYAVDFSKTRVQFGRPIAVFQAISHKLAAASIDVDSARLITYEAAWTLDQGLPSAEVVAACKAHVNEASKRVVQSSSQVMGGLGFMEVHDFGLYFMRQKSGELNLGDAGLHHDRLFEEIAAL
jgi:alkylation response protein AidB-like acyl-CoA dehydrogenase